MDTLLKSVNLPYPISQLENNPRCKFKKHEIRHYIFFWTCAGAIAGLGLGVGSLYRQYRYFKWVRKQPIEVQLKLLEKNNILSSGGEASHGIATARFSTLPKTMDTRIKLSFASEYRPYRWYEVGPLKLWNNFGDYPWASSAFIEFGKWSVRVSLLCSLTLAFESSFCLLFGYPLGINPYIRGASGMGTGYIVAKIASEGVLFWYETLGIALGLGALWAAATLYYPDWGQLARNNQFVIEMYSTKLHKSVKKYYESKELVKQLYEKDRKDKLEIYDEFLTIRDDELNKRKPIIRYEESKIDNVDITVASTQVAMKNIEQHWFLKWFIGRRKTEIPKEIEEMPYEERKKLEQRAIGGTIAVNYERYPFKILAKTQPQFYVMDNEKIRNQNDTVKFVNIMSQDDNKKQNVFDQNEQNTNDLRDLRILN
eukprot:246208_1